MSRILLTIVIVMLLSGCDVKDDAKWEEQIKINQSQLELNQTIIDALNLKMSNNLKGVADGTE